MNPTGSELEMDVFTVVEHRVDGTSDGGGSKRCQVQVPFWLAVTVQLLIALGLTGLLVWNFGDLDAARNGLPVFGRLAVILCLLASFYFQKTIFSSHVEIDDSYLIINLVLYVTSLLTGVTFWLVQMQYSSSLSPGVANYSSVEPIILVTALIVGIYTLRKVMIHYDNCKTEELDIYTRPIFPQLLIAFSGLETIFGVVFAIMMNMVVSADYEFSKRCGCLVGIFCSAVINELAITFSKESRSALLFKTGGFFINLLCTQMTWWLSYYKERQLTLYGLGVGFLTLLFGVLYTVEMSLQTAQLNSHNPEGHGPRSTFLASKSSQSQSGDLKKDNNEEEDSSSDALSEETSGAKILSRCCVIGFAVTLQIGLGLLPVVVLCQDIFFPATDPRKLSQDRIGNWFMWALGFFASLLLNEVILFQSRVNYILVCLCNSAFCINFMAGCIISYRGIRMSMEEHGIVLNFLVVGGMWIPYFLLSHLDFLRLTRFSLRLEEREVKRNSNTPQLSLFVASGVQSMVAIAAFLPITDFLFFPGKIFSILTFPSLTFISEVIFRFGKACRGPFVITFTAFFLGGCYSQMVWYISVVSDVEEEFLGMGKPWLLALGGVMGLATFLYVIRFLYVILTKWEKRD